MKRYLLFGKLNKLILKKTSQTKNKYNTLLPIVFTAYHRLSYLCCGKEKSLES
jgi:hypothetical protein